MQLETSERDHAVEVLVQSGVPFDVIAVAFNISRARISQLHKRVVDRRAPTIHVYTCICGSHVRRHPRPPETHFWPFVNMTGHCWEWQGTRSGAGYGVASVSGTDSAMTHRISWELTNGPIPLRMVVCHKCDNPPCVRPDHLFLGTYADNMRDMVRKSRGYVPPKRAPAESPVA